MGKAKAAATTTPKGNPFTALDLAEQQPLFEERPRVVRETKELLRLPLRDKPVGYALGNKASRILTVITCPLCKQSGARVTEARVIHQVIIYEKDGRQRLDTRTDSCVLSLLEQKKVPWSA